MAVEGVDARDEAAFAAWFAVLDASVGHERPGEPHWSLQEQREIALAGLPDDTRAADEQHLLLDRERGGAARLTLHGRDNINALHKRIRAAQRPAGRRVAPR